MFFKEKELSNENSNRCNYKNKTEIVKKTPRSAGIVIPCEIKNSVNNCYRFVKFEAVDGKIFCNKICGKKDYADNKINHTITVLNEDCFLNYTIQKTVLLN